MQVNWISAESKKSSTDAFIQWILTYFNDVIWAMWPYFKWNSDYLTIIYLSQSLIGSTQNLISASQNLVTHSQNDQSD